MQQDFFSKVNVSVGGWKEVRGFVDGVGWPVARR